MALQDSQLAAFKAAIQAETAPTFVSLRAEGATGAMAAWFNENSTSVAWKNRVSLSDVVANVDAVELVGLTAIRLSAYQCLLLAGFVDPSKARTRAGFDQVFSAAGGATTRPLLLALWKRFATRGEKVFLTGAGTDASPATLGYEGSISDSDVVRALNA